jgi:hypothetical protein
MAIVMTRWMLKLDGDNVLTSWPRFPGVTLNEMLQDSSTLK